MTAPKQVDAEVAIGCGCPPRGEDPGGGRTFLQGETQASGVGDLLLKIQNRALSRLVITSPREGGGCTVNDGPADR